MRQLPAENVPYFVGSVQAAADYLAPGAIEVNRYQAEIFDLVRRRFPFGQRVNQVPATGQPSRYFEQTAIATATYADPRNIAAGLVPSQPTRVERYVTLKAIVAQINYSLFDVEVNQQQGQFAYLEAKDLTDTVDGALKLHDLGLWTGNDTDLINPTTTQYFGVSGQIFTAPTVGAVPPTTLMSSTGSLVDTFKTKVANMVARQDFEVKPSAIYLNPIASDFFDQEAKAVQLYFNEVEVIPGVIVKALPTQAGLLPLIPDPSISVFASLTGGVNLYTGFIVSEEFIEYHWLTSPVPRVFQLGLVGSLSGQFTIVKFGAVVVKGPSYAHTAVYFFR
ncbi:MAG: hypothetical protein KGN01_06140 [Patescibacteria group bacterium]|nr:hypothetical protein [Patescibacteria group bacterium]